VTYLEQLYADFSERVAEYQGCREDLARVQAKMLREHASLKALEKELRRHGVEPPTS
jgi:hypothetical protein